MTITNKYYCKNNTQLKISLRYIIRSKNRFKEYHYKSEAVTEDS